MSDRTNGNVDEVLRRGLAPRAVAVYGASSRRLASQAARIARRILENGYADRTVLVNPNPQEVHGVATVARAQDSPLAGELDFAVISVPRHSVIDAVDDCAAAGIRLAVVTSARFAEADAEGAELQAALVARAASHGIRLFGPNCMGLANFTDGLWAADPKSPPRAGNVSILSQSGLLSMRIMDYIVECGQGIDIWVTMGNSADLDPPTMVEHLATRPVTRVVVLYLEAVPDPERLRGAIRTARAAGKEVVLLKSGRTERGSRTAATHTGALASPDVFVDVLAEETGCIRVDTVREAAQVASILATIGRPSGGFAVAGGSGGDCVLAADECTTHGVPLATLRPETIERMLAVVPESATTNPIDVSPFTWDGSGRQNDMAAAIASDPGVGCLVLLDGWGWEQVEGADGVRRLELGPLVGADGKLIVPLINDSRMPVELRELLGAAGVVTTADAETIWRSLAHIARAAGIPSDVSEAVDEEPVGHDAAPRRLPELAAFERLRGAGVPMVETRVVESTDELLAACSGFGYPVVLKGIVPGVIHKADRQLVHVDVWGDDEATRIWTQLSALAT